MHPARKCLDLVARRGGLRRALKAGAQTPDRQLHEYWKHLELDVDDSGVVG